MSAVSTEISGLEAEQSILCRRIGPLSYLVLKESLVLEESVAKLRSALDACDHACHTRVVLDLVKTPLLNSLALDALLDAQDRMLHLGGWLKVTNITPTNLEILGITGLVDYVKVLDRQEQNTGTAQQLQSPPKKGMKFGQILVDRGLISKEKVDEALSLQDKLGKSMGQIMVDKGWIASKHVLEALSEQLGIPHVHLRPGFYDQAVVELLDKKIAKRLRVLPLFKVRDVVSLATAEPQAIPVIDEIEERLGCKVQTVLASREDIVKTINSIFSGNECAVDVLADVDDDFQVIESLIPDDYTAIDEMAEGSPVINLVNSIIQRAVRDGASDVHIEPTRSTARVRSRVDGVLYEIMKPRAEMHPAIVSRLKVMANLDIAERRMPQDGRIQVQTQGRLVDLRFSSLPGLFGEKVVLRVLDKNQSLLDVNKLGMSENNLHLFKGLFQRTNGLILVTGPTGSGKTTSLYAALNYLNSIEKNIVTIEDPVEYQVDIVNQNEVRERIGLSFAKMLKHVLRQDPDIIMVGEIRDGETAEIAVQAALTGHLVLTTLHTNQATGAITRMIDMGVEPYLLSSALIGVMAQRLVRTICPNCRTHFIASPEITERYGWGAEGTVRLARGRGCPECFDSGYKGRIGIHEILVANEALQKLVISSPSRDELDRFVSDQGMQSLFEDGLGHVRHGHTTIEEVSRVINI